ncbi:DegT/DnrJ/EryC1/StrS family aminotransferase [Crossiella cryophila]|uniref:DegT/DnrJ/EryC1/StrS family aminotransferase n=1 Tax=Crossiella cryophila TaxID=43355 RepID=UPI00160F884E
MGVLSSPVQAGISHSALVPFFTQSATFEQLWPLISERVERVVSHGKYSHGRQVAELEQALCAYTGARYALGVNSGTDALVLLLRAAGLRPGDEVLVPAFTFIATASAVVLAGGRPVFTDIEPASYAMDPAALAAAITPRCRFVLPVHLFHQLADLDALGAVAGRAGLTMIEDSAEAIGMRWDGRHAGLFGAGGVLSFFPTKTLGALGDAGAVLTDDPRIADRVAALRHHGRGGRTLDHFPGIANETGLSGCNSKMDDLQAAVLLAKLTRLDADIARRGELAAAYSAQLSRISGITRLPTVVKRNADTTEAYYVYLIEVDDRDELAGYLANRGVETEIYYPTPLHLQPCFAHLGHRPGDFPVAEAACRRALALPLYPDLTEAQVDRVCAVIGEFYSGSA